MIELSGIVERITYYNEKDGFSVIKFSVNDNKDYKDETVTAVGYFHCLETGERLKLKGDWILHKDYGYQFKTEFYEVITPATINDIEKYLASGAIKGIGPATAKRIVDEFGEKTLEILNSYPDELLKIPGIGEKKLNMITKSYEEQREIRDIMLFLQQYGIGPAVAVKIYKKYKEKATQVLKENPYRLADEVEGIGFKTADYIAQKMGIENNSMERLEAGLKYTLLKAADEGHVFLPADKLLYKTSELLGVESELLNQPLLALEEKEEIVIDRSWGSSEVYLAAFYYLEKSIARKLFLLAQMIDKPLEITDETINEIEKLCKIQLAKRQREALEKAAQNGVIVITGGPGTGKTTTIQSLLKFFEKHKLKAALAAPTGRAAKRMAEATGKEAKTIHRLLEYNAFEHGAMAFGKNQESLLEEDVIIVDEMSMVDITLMYHLLSAIKPGARLILVGDKDQLPSVGPGSVLKEIIESDKISTVVLDEIFRQAQESMIVVNAHRINKGYFPYLNVKDKDFFFEQVLSPEDILETILEMVKERLPNYGNFDPFEDIQILTPMKKGIVGVINLNERLQHILNPPSTSKKECKYHGQLFREGDKVMQIKNNYEKEVFNGDLGRITNIDEDDDIVTVTFQDIQQEKNVTYCGQEIEELNLAYALSVHKSQGSEFPAVIIPITTSHYVMLQRNLLYTAVTRAKRLLVLVGSKQALTLSIQNNRALKRYGHLSDRIIEEFSCGIYPT